MNDRIVIVGGGAAGLTAAIAAATRGAVVTVLERLPRVGKKILATGNGRCNLTNVNLAMANYHGEDSAFATYALERFDVDRTLGFFADLGIEPRIETGGKVYPASGQASSVLDVLRYELDRLGVEIRCEAGVKEIRRAESGFTLQLKDQSQLKAGRVIIATGGQAYPGLGSDGSGFTLAKNLGHTIVEPFPALVQLRLAAGFLKQVKGLKFEGVVRLLTGAKAGGKVVGTARGEILFADYGISGPPILELSRMTGERLKAGEEVWLRLTVLDLPEVELDRLLVDRFKSRPCKTLEFSLVGLINKRLIPVLCREAGIDDTVRPVAKVTPPERLRLVKLLRDWRLQVTGTTSWASAQVTAGGVRVAEVNPRTMESKLVPGLYFAGEVLDIDGDCGGFNLQWAWSSGWVAGSSVIITI